LILYTIDLSSLMNIFKYPFWINSSISIFAWWHSFVSWLFAWWKEHQLSLSKPISSLAEGGSLSSLACIRSL